MKINNNSMKEKYQELFSVVIVAYNPDSRLRESINRLNSNSLVGLIIVVDNSTQYNEVIKDIEKFDKTYIINNNGNRGIAYAQNRGIEYAYKKEYKWTLTLDHDTIIKKSLLENYYSFLCNNDCSNVAIIGTDYYDIGSQKREFDNHEIISVDLTISSGSLINISLFFLLGGMKEHYFIDQVDNEYCFRAKKRGYDIVILPGVGMEHRLGQIEKKRIIGHTFFIYNQNPIRTFYRTRNIIYFLREYGECKLYVEKIKILFLDLIRILFEKDKKQKYKEFIFGIYHGFLDKI